MHESAGVDPVLPDGAADRPWIGRTGYRVRGTRSVAGFCWWMGLLPGPLLVAAAGAGPDLHSSTVSRASTGHVEAEAGLASDDGAIGVEGPLLVRAAVAVVDLYSGARCLGMARHVEALVAVYLQLTIGQGGPLLVCAAGAVPYLQQRPVGCGRPWHIQAAVRSHSPQDPSRTAATAATPAGATTATPAVLEAVETGLVGDAQREVGATAIERGDRARCIKAGTRTLRLGRLLDAHPQNRAHTQAAHRVGEGVEVGDVVGAVPGSVVVHSGVHRHAEFGQDRPTGVSAQAALEAGHPVRLGGMGLSAQGVHVDRQQGAVQPRVATH